jgi:hypothetical protein
MIVNAGDMVPIPMVRALSIMDHVYKVLGVRITSESFSDVFKKSILYGPVR